MTGRRASAVDVATTSGRNTVARTRTKERRDAVTSRQRRFAHSTTDESQSTRRFARSAGQSKPARRFGRGWARPSGGALRTRRRQREQSAAQKLMEGVRGMLPGGGKSSAGRRSGRSMSGVGDLLSSLGGGKKRRAARGRKPAIFGLLGAGAAGAAAAVAKRRHGSRSPEPPKGDASGTSQAQTPSTATPAPAQRADAPMPGETDRRSDDPIGDETAAGPDTPTEGDQRG